MYGYKHILAAGNLHYKEHYDRMGELDPAHDWDHICNVVENVIKINTELEKQNMRVRRDVMEAALIGAYLHDFFSANYRNEHEIMARNWILNHRGVLAAEFQVTGEVIEMAAIAAAEHRASFKGKRSCTAAEILSAADFNHQHPIERMVRSVKFHTDDTNSPIEVIEKAAEHVVEKFIMKTGKYSELTSDESFYYHTLYPEATEEQKKWKERYGSLGGVNLLVRDYLEEQAKKPRSLKDAEIQ